MSRCTPDPQTTWLYLLLGHDGRHTYVGISNNPKRRLATHNSARNRRSRHYTRNYQPWTMLACVTGFCMRKDALRAEYRVKHTAVSRIITRNLPPGPWRRVVHLCKIVASDGLTVTLCGLSPPGWARSYIASLPLPMVESV